MLSSTINGLLRCHKVSVILEFCLEILEMLTVESKVHFTLFSLVFPSFPPCPFKFLFVWLRPLDEFSGTRYPGLTADRYDILVLEMYVMYLVLSRGSVLHSLRLVVYELCRPDVSLVLCSCHGNSTRN